MLYDVTGITAKAKIYNAYLEFALKEDYLLHLVTRSKSLKRNKNSGTLLNLFPKVSLTSSPLFCMWIKEPERTSHLSFVTKLMGGMPFGNSKLFDIIFISICLSIFLAPSLHCDTILLSVSKAYWQGRYSSCWGDNLFKRASTKSGHLVILCIGNMRKEYRVSDWHAALDSNIFKFSLKVGCSLKIAQL